jgi:hypothetical protein
MSDHNGRQGQTMPSRHGRRQPCIIACRPVTARHPGDTARNDLAARQQHDAAGGVHR